MLGSSGRSTLISGILHVLVIVAVVLLASHPPKILTDHLPLDTKVYIPRTPHAVSSSNSGGGGGQRSPTPPSKGPLPRFSPMVITPPIIRTNLDMPELPVAPSILGPAETPVVSYQIGIPLGAAGAPSGGGGKGGGLGDGDGRGVGDDKGPGALGPGLTSGLGGPPKGRLTLPELVTKKEPEFTEEARRAKLQGTVDLVIVVGADGRVANVQVIRGLGLGLDERAVDAVKQWKFRPGTADGKPIAMSASVAVTFRLL